MLLLQPEPNIWLISTVTTWLLRIFIHLPRKQSPYLACEKWFVDLGYRGEMAEGLLQPTFLASSCIQCNSSIHLSCIFSLRWNTTPLLPSSSELKPEIIPDMTFDFIHAPCWFDTLCPETTLLSPSQLPLTLVQSWVIFQLVFQTQKPLHRPFFFHPSSISEVSKL